MMIFFEGTPLCICDREEHKWLPRWVCPDDERLARNRPVIRYKSFHECVKERKPRTILLHRTYALGDIIMLLPVARAFRRLVGLKAPIAIAVNHRHYKDLCAMSDGTVHLVRSFGIIDYGADLHIELDKVLEADHRDQRIAAMDRLQIYAGALGCKL